MRLILERGGDIATLVRGANADSLVVVADSTLGPLASALARAAIGTLAIERAPRCRVNGVFSGERAAQADIDAAVAFLERARSTTGQIVEVHAAMVG